MVSPSFPQQVQPTPEPVPAEPTQNAPPVEPPIPNPNQPTQPTGNVLQNDPAYVAPSTPPNIPTLPQPQGEPPQSDPQPQPQSDPAAPVIRMADGTEVPLNDYKVKLPSGQEMSYNEMLQQQQDVDRQVAAIQAEQERLARWEQATQQALASGQAHADPQQQHQVQPVAPQTQDQAPQLPTIDPAQLGDMATENEIRIAQGLNQLGGGLNQYLAQQQQQMQQMQEMLTTQQQVAEQQLLNQELARVSNETGVPADDILNEAQRTGVSNLDVVGQNLQYKQAMNNQTAQQQQQAAQQVTQAVGTGPTTHNPQLPAQQQQATPGRGIKDYRNGAEVMERYDILPGVI